MAKEDKEARKARAVCCPSPGWGSGFGDLGIGLRFEELGIRVGVEG